MNNRSMRSILVMLALIPILLAMMSPAMADDNGIKIKIKPSNTIVNSTDDSYSATMEPKSAPPGGFFFLNVTIPAGYNFSLPAAGQTVANYTMFNKTSHSNQVIINITSNNSGAETVDVRFSTDYGGNYSTSPNQSIKNIVIGSSSLKLTKPSNIPGYLNLSLGGAGPVLEKNIVTVILANGTLKNPGTPGNYIWYLEAKNAPSDTANTSSDVVKIKAGASKVVVKPVLDNDTPAEASLPLPEGNLTVNITTIPGVVVANLIMTLRNFTDNPIPEQTAGAPGPGFMWIGIDVPALQGVNFTARVSVNYSSVVKKIKITIPEANLKLYHFNDTSSTWEVGSNNNVDTVNTIVSADFNSFSTFAIMGAAAGGGPSPSGGGSGGGGVTTSEPFENIVKSETYDKSLIANTSVTYIFKTPELGIYEIAVTGMENENDISLRVEALKGTSKLVTASPPGTVYMNLNIWAGTKRIKEAIIRFKVNNSWLDSNKAATNDIRMLKWDVDKWVQLETSETAKDSTSTSYEAKTDSFAVFAISSVKGVEVPTAVQTPATTTVTPVKTIVPEATKKIPGFGAIITIIAIALLVSCMKKRR